MEAMSGMVRYLLWSLIHLCLLWFLNCRRRLEIYVCYFWKVVVALKEMHLSTVFLIDFSFAGHHLYRYIVVFLICIFIHVSWYIMFEKHSTTFPAIFTTLLVVISLVKPPLRHHYILTRTFSQISISTLTIFFSICLENELLDFCIDPFIFYLFLPFRNMGLHVKLA